MGHRRRRRTRLFRIPFQAAATMERQYGLHGAVTGRTTTTTISWWRTTATSLATWFPQLLLHSHLDHLLVVRRSFIAGWFVGRTILVLSVQQLADSLQVALKLPLMSRPHPHAIKDDHPTGEHSEDAQGTNDENTGGCLKIRILVHLGEVVVWLVGVPATIVVQVGPILFAGVRLVAAIAAMIEAVAVQPDGDAVVVPAQELRADIAIYGSKVINK